jgi:hypothetical protein
MVSEGDLIGRADSDREARLDWWLRLVAEGETLSQESLTRLHNQEQTAHHIMSAPVVTVDETATDKEIARLLTTYRIKRVPVVRDARIVGIVSRADILRAFVAEQGPSSATDHDRSRHGQIFEALLHLDEQFLGRGHADATKPIAQTEPGAVDAGVMVADFRALVADYERQKARNREALYRALAETRRQKIRDLATHHIADQQWQALLLRAREAAERGEPEVLLTRFPSDLCSDGGRAVNASEPDWPATLRGEAAEILLRWEQELKPGGFRMVARVLDFPGGIPGDIGLFLVWGQ